MMENVKQVKNNSIKTQHTIKTLFSTQANKNLSFSFSLFLL